MTAPELGHRVRQRFFSRVDKQGVNACWIWKGGVMSTGYGRFYIGKKMWLAHRVSYAVAGGVLRKDRQIDHLCRNRLCVRPSHLEQVTQRTNILRGTAPSAVCAQKTNCKYGHPFSIENTTVSGGKRRCRECNRHRLRARYASKRKQTSEEITS